MNTTASQNLTDNDVRIFLQQIRYPLYTCYIVFGTPAVIANLAIFVILLSDKKLLAKSAMIAGLAGGNLFNGLHAFGYGVYRVPLLLTGQIDSPANNWACMASLMPTFLLLGHSIPSCMQLVIGLERMVAVVAFNWYRMRWSSKKSWYTVLVVYLLLICGWGGPAWYQNFHEYRLVSKECSSGVILGVDMTNRLFFFVVMTGIVGMLCVFTAVSVGRWRYSKAASSASRDSDFAQMKKQLRVSRMMLIIALFEFLFVIFPNILIALTSVIQLPPVVAVYSIVIYCINSSTNIFVYFFMNSDFRKAAAKRLNVFPCCDGNQVMPVSVSNSRALDGRTSRINSRANVSAI